MLGWVWPLCDPRLVGQELGSGAAADIQGKYCEGQDWTLNPVAPHSTKCPQLSEAGHRHLLTF